MNYVQYLPVEGCEECDANIEVLGRAAAGACNEGIEYGEAKAITLDGQRLGLRVNHE